MSGNEKKKEQAQKLLRSFTDVDDRYLAEAMEEPEAGRPGRRKTGRYSRWALTAAACLTVVIIGRYVTLNRNADMVTEKSEVTSVIQSEGDEDAKGALNATSDEAAATVSGEDADGAAATVSGEAPDEAAAVTSDEAPEALYEAAQESSQIANPFIDTETYDEAQKMAGFEMNLPEAVEPYTVLLYRVVKGEMLEIIFCSKADEEGYRIRKAAGEDDISGDYNEYAVEKTVSLSEGTEVTLRGDKEDSWSSAVWTTASDDAENGYSYAICTGEKTFTTDEIIRMAEEMSGQ